LVQFDKVEEKGYPWNFELPGKGGFKIDPEMVEGLKAGRDKLEQHGWLNWFSCQPQVNTCIPKMGEYCASSESSCAAYINTIIGARTNRESPINTVLGDCGRGERTKGAAHGTRMGPIDPGSVQG
jgi:predicted aconitase